ncbi:EamA family transporter [Streptomyces sp. CMB-StM0423]|uniref:EamA family transporter n=1 Tax=Streptomyces sp. CMB-StM0423 TaxID=2059884 RepID=UPI002D768342|nr:EamA family transporter [Streptomyces sp. CMB-StM0423]
MLAGITVAVLSAVLPYSLELAALRRLPTRTVGVLVGLEPASAGLAGVLVLDEHLGTVQWAALACVGIASAGTVIHQKAERPPGPPVPHHPTATPTPTACEPPSARTHRTPPGRTEQPTSACSPPRCASDVPSGSPAPPASDPRSPSAPC